MPGVSLFSSLNRCPNRSHKTALRVATSPSAPCGEWPNRRSSQQRRRPSASSKAGSSVSSRRSSNASSLIVAPYGPHIALIDGWETEREKNRERNQLRDILEGISDSFDRSAMIIQAWWRCQATQKRYGSIKRITAPWKSSGILHPNEGVVYGSMCNKLPCNSSQAAVSPFLRQPPGRRVFLMLTTSSRLLCCEPASPKVLEHIQLSHGETTCCDHGNQTFSVASTPSCKGCSFHLTFEDLLSSSTIWVDLLRELPTARDLIRVHRKNSLRASNFPINKMGMLSVDSDSSIRRALGVHESRLGVLVGTRLVLIKSTAGSTFDFVDLDQFTAVDKLQDATVAFIVRNVTGESRQCYCKDEAERDQWMHEIGTVVHTITVGFMRLGQKSLDCTRRRSLSERHFQSAVSVYSENSLMEMAALPF